MENERTLVFLHWPSAHLYSDHRFGLLALSMKDKLAYTNKAR
jgi:hypothetical protein